MNILRTKKGITPTLSDIDIRLLHVFRAVTESKGFANAETVLNIGRSTISAQMATLEGRLGLRLCERGPGGFSLTDEGREVYAASTRLLMALNEFRTDTNLTQSAVYQAQGGVAVPVRVIARRPDEIIGFGETRIHSETTLFDVRTSDILDPRPGDHLTVDNVAYVIQGEPERRDPDRLVWTLDVRPL